MTDIKYDNNETEDEFEGRLYIILTLTGKELIPDDITTQLNIKPSYSFKRCDLKVSGSGEQRVRKHGCWSIDSDNKGFSSNNPQPHFEWLLGVLEPVDEKLNEILASKNVDARASCFWIVPDGRINLEIEPEFILRFAKLNIKIWFDIHCDH